MAKVVVGAEVKVTTGAAEQSVGNIRKQLKEANAELIRMRDQFGETSDQAIEAAKRVAQLKDTIEGAQEAAALFDPGKRFQAFSTAASQVAAGFSAVQGAMALAGTESEDLQKQLLKVQGAIALSQGLSELKDLGKSYEQLKIVAVDAFKSIRAAISSTGIGLLVVALGTIVAYWDDIKEAVTGVNEETKDLATTSAALAKTERDKLADLDSQDAILKLQGKSEKEILQIKINQIDAAIEKTKIELEASKRLAKEQYDAEVRNKAILKGILDFSAGGLNIILKGVDAIGSVFGKDFGLSGKLNNYLSGLVFDPEETKAKGDAAVAEIDKTLKDLTNRRAQFQLNINDIDKKSAEDAKKQRDDRAAALAQEQADFEEWQQQQIDAYNATLDAEAEARKKAQEQEQADFDEYQQEQIDKWNEALDAEAEARKTKQDELRQQLIAEGRTPLQILENELAERLKLVQGNAELELAVTQDFEQRKTALVQAETQQRLSIVSGILGQAADLLGKQTAAGKALAIAEATINTYTGATAALRSKVPFPEPVATGIRIAQAGLIIANGLKAIKNIAATKVPGGASGGVPSAALSAPSAPVTPQAQTTTINQAQVNQIGNAAARAFVLETDIANNTERVRRINRAARIN